MADRWSRLALVSQIRGALDYTSVPRFDWKWRLKENLVFDVLEDEMAAQVNTLAHQWHCSAAQVTGWDEKETLFNHHSKHVRQAYNTVGKLTLPWYKQWTAEERSLAQLWQDFKNAEKDPVFADYLKKERQELYDKVADEDRKLGADTEAKARYIRSQKEQAKKVADRKERKRNAKLRRV